MKINRVLVDNRKKSFLIQAGERSFEFPFSQLKVKPSKENLISHVEVERELGNEGFTYQLQSGQSDTVHIDHVLHACQDPEFQRTQLIYELTIQAQRSLVESKLTKRQVARLLKTSPAQLYRLLDQTNNKKTIDQMVKLMLCLGKEVIIKLKSAA